jgi:hypothetical protein
MVGGWTLSIERAAFIVNLVIKSEAAGSFETLVTYMAELMFC